MEKKEIRRELLAKRDALANSEWDCLSKRIQRTIIQSKLYKKADCILCYADYRNEVGTYVLLDDAILRGKDVYLPKVLEDFHYSCMQFYRIASTFELIDGYKGIKEPLGNISTLFDYEKYKDKNILMLVPGVAFDKSGNRLGYGKGYYDTYLSGKEKILKCGMCFDIQYIDEIPSEFTDIKMDYVITENSTLSEINNINF